MARTTDDIPYLTDEQIKIRAEHFLKSIGRVSEQPTDIEKICEYDLGIRIDTVPLLEKDLSIHAYITSDFTSISIDEACFTSNIPRARFSLAHEVGHYVLHKDFYSKQAVQSLNDYIKFQNSITPAIDKRMEIQANIFAGFLLIPPKQLAKLVKEHTGKPATSDMTGSFSEVQRVFTAATEEFNVSQRAVLMCFKREYPSMYSTLMAEV